MYDYLETKNLYDELAELREENDRLVQTIVSLGVDNYELHAENQRYYEAWNFLTYLYRAGLDENSELFQEAITIQTNELNQE